MQNSCKNIEINTDLRWCTTEDISIMLIETSSHNMIVYETIPLPNTYLYLSSIKINYLTAHVETVTLVAPDQPDLMAVCTFSAAYKC